MYIQYITFLFLKKTYEIHFQLVLSNNWYPITDQSSTGGKHKHNILCHKNAHKEVFHWEREPHWSLNKEGLFSAFPSDVLQLLRTHCAFCNLPSFAFCAVTVQWRYNYKRHRSRWTGPDGKPNTATKPSLGEFVERESSTGVVYRISRWTYNVISFSWNYHPFSLSFRSPFRARSKIQQEVHFSTVVPVIKLASVQHQ